MKSGVWIADYILRYGAAGGLPAVFVRPAACRTAKSPELDGLQVLEYIKSDRESDSVPVVMMTASREGQDLLRSHGPGVNATVVKPVRFQDFVRAVQDLGGFWAVLNKPPSGSASIQG